MEDDPIDNNFLFPNNTNVKLYFTSCFHKNFSEKFKFKENSISIERQIQIQKNPDYLLTIYSYQYNKELKFQKKLNFEMNFDENQTNYNIEINVKSEKIRFIFDLIEIKNNFDLIKLLDQEAKIPTINSNNFYLPLNIDEIFSFYYDHLSIQNKEKKVSQIELDEYAKYLIDNYISQIKSKKYVGDQRSFSSILNLFVLCYEKERIVPFLDLKKSIKIELEIYEFEKIDNKFFDILAIYESDNEKFFLPINKETKNSYSNLLKNFIDYYYIINDSKKIKIEKGNVDEIEKMFKELIKNCVHVLKCLSFIINKFELFAEINRLEIDIRNKRYIFKIENSFQNDINNFHSFKGKYLELIKLEGKSIFIDFSNLIEKCINNFKNNINLLKDLYFTFRTELIAPFNIKLFSKLRDHIHNLGVTKCNKGEFTNKQILDFLSYDEYFTTKIDKKEKEKNIIILENIKINSKNDINEIESNEIYKYFLDMKDKFLEIFLKKINKIEDLSYFYQILPINNFDYKASDLLKKWIQTNIKTFSIKSFPKFKEDINIFISILYKTSKENLNSFLDFISKNLDIIYCKELFIFILNKNTDLSLEYSNKHIIMYFTNENNAFDSFKYFIENLENKKDNIITEFYKQIDYLSLEEKDIYSKMITNKWKIFELLLDHKKDFISNRNGMYLESTIKVCKNFLYDIKELNLKFNFIVNQSLSSNIKFKERIKKVLFLIEDIDKENKNYEIMNEQAEKYYNNLVNKFSEWETKIDELNMVVEYYKIFYKNTEKEQNKKKETEIFIREIKNNKLKKLLTEQNILNKIHDYKSIIKEANKMLELNKNSLLFREIYESNQKKIRNEYNLLKETDKNFHKAIDILSLKPNEIHNNEFIDFYCEIGYRNEKDLFKEIEWLIQYLKNKIKIDQKDKIKLKVSLSILIKKKSLDNIVTGILSFIKLYDNIKSNDNDKNIFGKLEECNKLLEKKISSEKLKEIIQYVEKHFKNISLSSNNDNLNNNKIIEFFVEFNKNNDSFIFLKNKDYDQIENIKEFYFDFDESDLTFYDLDEFVKAIRFLNFDIKNSKNKFELINNLISGILNEEKCGNCLKNILKKIQKIKNFLEKCSKGEEGCFTKIKRIMEKSYFRIYFKEDKIEIIGAYEKNIFVNLKNINQSFIDKKDFDYHFLDQNELENLYQKSFISKNQDNLIEGIQQFIHLYKDMIKLTNILNKLYSYYGYPIPDNIQIDVEKKNIKCIVDKNDNIILKDLKNKFSDIYKKCEIEKIIEETKEIRFFSGKQLYLINSSLKDNKFDKIKDLICCISDGKIKKFKDDYKYTIDFEDKYKNLINNIKNYLNNQLKYNNQTIEKIYQNNKISNNLINQLNGGFYYYLRGNDVELFLLTMFFNITGNYPSNNNLLLCNKDTCFEEIQSFIRRAVYCEYQNLFVIAKCELLKLHRKKKLLSELKKKSSIQTKNVIVVVFSEEESDFHKLISKLKNINVFQFEQHNSDSIIDNRKENVEIVTSRCCGLGKSAYIINDINKEKIYFPLGGEINRKQIIERIKNEIPNIDTNINYIFYIVLGQTKDIEILKEFFFKLLIFRRCDYNNNVKYLSSNVHIKIEIPNDFMSYFKYIKFLLLYKNKNINRLENINLSKEAKIVTTFLSKYENNELLNRNIKNIDIECNPSQNQCQQLILKYIGINEPNFYQINIFIKILSHEFQVFNKCYGLSPKFLINSGNSLNLRNIIINSLIKITKHFTIGPYEDLIKNQEITKKILNSKEDEKDIYINGALFLNINSISYDDINPSLVAFNKDKDSITIITTCKEDTLEYKNLERLHISQSFEYIKQFRYRINRNLNINANKLKGNNFEDDLSIINYLLNKDNNNKINKENKIIVDQNKVKNEIFEMNILNESNDINDFSEKEKNNIPKLKNVKNLGPDEILDKLLIFLNINGLKKFEKKYIIGNYIYTPDNFIKVILILMRLRAKVPVIMMGETGCGKTYLIQMAYKLITKGKKSLKILNIHAGTDDNDIIKFIKKVEEEVKKEDEDLLNEEMNEYDNYPEKDKKEFEKYKTRDEQKLIYKEKISKRQIWIFFDEINTCNSMGLLSEILCHNSIRGKKINERFVFIAACNPYRLLSKESKIENILFHKNAEKKKLVYSVNPLPHSLLNFVFNFGSLKENDEKKYIESMVIEPTKYLISTYDKKEVNNKKYFQKLINLQIDLLSLCQNFMKDKNDISIVSLREVNRFIIFLKSFVEFLNKRNDDEYIKKKEEEIMSYYRNRTKYDIILCGINLAIYMCYYLRLQDKETREQFEELINKRKFFSGDFIEIPNLELNYLINNLEIPVGIAKNQNLKENVFASFYCITNSIPLIICGKPGRGKTLSIKILMDSMKGKEGSKSFICRLFNEIMMKKIQGSLNTTSEEIINTFEKTRKLQRENPGKIFFVLMDEMGLAEIGYNNPLKVIHYELEKETDIVSFVGISNWSMDASKMNRVVYLIDQEPDEEDLKITAREIVRSYELYIKRKVNYYEKFQNAFDSLSKAYYNFIEEKKRINYENSSFHGSRDFYSLIKTTMEDIIKNMDSIEGLFLSESKKKSKLYEICLRNIERNFGGLEDTINEFKYIFCTIFNNGPKEIKFQNNYDILTYLQESLYDNSSRYLLIILDSFVSQDILFYMLEEINNNSKKLEKENKINSKENKNNKNNINIIKKDDANEDEDEEEEINTTGIIKNVAHSERKNKEIIYYLGSKFKEDEEKLFYSDEMLNKIKYQMEKSNILVLKDLEIVYPPLYELFNRNFIDLNGKKYTYLGKSQTRTLVNEDFKVIVCVDKEKIKNQDPPFLNRFEKHIISIKNILDEKYIELADDIFSVLKEIKILINTKNQILNLNLKFIDIEEVRGLIFIAIRKGLKDNEIKTFILEKIVPTFTEDIIICIKKSNFERKYNYYYNSIIEIYKRNYRYNLYDYLQKTKNKISIIYTFSSINDNIYENKAKIKNDYFSQKFEKESCKEIIINEIDSISYLGKEIFNFLTEESYNLCVIRLREDDLIKLKNILNEIRDNNDENYSYFNNEKKINKIFTILIHLSRTKIKSSKQINENTLSYLSEIPQIFIDNINNEFDSFLDIIDSSNDKIIFKLNINFSNQFDFCLRNFAFNIINGQDIYGNNINERQYKINIIDKIKNENLKIIIDKSLKLMSSNENDYLDSVFTEISNEDNDFMDSLNTYLSGKIIKKHIFRLIYIYEKNQIFTSILSNKKLLEFDIIKEKIKDYIENYKKENINLEIYNINNKKNMSILYGIKLPFIQNILMKIFDFIKNNIKSKYIQNDSFLMKNIFTDSLKYEKDKYNEQMKQLEINVINEIDNYPFILNIFDNKDKNLINNLFHDCFYVFLLKSNIFKDNYEKLIKILDLIIQLRLNPIIIEKNCKKEIIIESSFINLYKVNNEIERNIIIEENKSSLDINLFVKILNFIESYSKEIYFILEIYNSIDKKNNIYESIINSIVNGEIPMDDERNPEYAKNLKCCFYYIIEALLMVLRKSNDNSFKNYKKIQSYFENIIKLERQLKLFSKELFTLDIINKVITYYVKHSNKNINNEQNINKLINSIGKGPDLIKESIYDDIINNLKEVRDSLKSLYGESPEYAELLNNILLKNYQIIPIIELRKKIIEDILPKQNKSNNLISFVRVIFGEANNCEPKKFLDKNSKNEDEIKLLFASKNKDLILFYFENCIEQYFLNMEKKYNNDNKIKINKISSNDSINYLKKSIENMSKDDINFITKIYSIAYIKRYMKHYFDLIFSNNIQNLAERAKINNSLFRNDEIKFFALKLCLIKYNYELGVLINIDKERISEYLNYSEFFSNIIIQKESMILKYFSFPTLSRKNINENFFSSIIHNNNNNNNINIKSFEIKDYKEFLDLIKKEINDEKIEDLFRITEYNNNKYDILYTYLTYTLYFSYLNNDYKSIENLNKILNYFSAKNNSNLTFNYFLNEKFERILSKIGIQNNKEIKKYKIFRKIEILIYAFRFYFNVLAEKKNNNFYYLLLTKFKETTDTNFIPGKLIKNEKIISFNNIKNNLMKNPRSIECLCSCNRNYTLSNVNDKFNCQHKIEFFQIFPQKSFKRVFINEKEKDYFYKKYPDKKEESILLTDLKNTISKEKNQYSKGFKYESKNFFLEKNDDEIGYLVYRLLNFILYGIIFYLDIDEKISEIDLNNCLVESMTCFEIIEKDWEIIDKELKARQFPNIHIFMDNIFDKLFNIMNQQKNFKEGDLKSFENSIGLIIDEEIKKKDSIQNYFENRNKFIDINPNINLSIILEEELYNNNMNFNKKEFPNIEYFNILKMPSFEDFKNEFNYYEKNKDNFPILNAILNENSEIKYLKYLPKLNELCNYLIDNYSYKYSREEIKSIKIDDIEDENKKNLVEEIINLYDELRPKISSYGKYSFKNENGEMKFNSLKDERNLSINYFCVDIGECNYGMVLASIYLEMIKWQNTFINKVIYSNNNLYNAYKGLFDYEIMIQNATENEIVTLPSSEDLMKDYVLKYCYEKKYQIIDYNFKLIEEELASKILPTIKKFIFDDNKCLNYFIYKYEVFRGNKENIITLFNKKYEKKELAEEESNFIINHIKRFEKKENKKITDLWTSLQILIDIILENNYNGNVSISKVIKDNNRNKHLQNLNELFVENNKDKKGKKIEFKVNSLMSIFCVIELICWGNIKENLVDNFKKDINDDIKNKFDEFFKRKESIITIDNLSTAIKRLVSRYLSGKNRINEIDEKDNLIHYLYKQELWDTINIEENPKFNEELNILFGINNNQSMVTLGQATKLFDYLIDMLINKNNKKDDEFRLSNLLTKIKAGKILNLFKKEQLIDNDENNDENDINRQDSRSSISSEKSYDSNKNGFNFDSSDNSDENDNNNNKNIGYNGIERSSFGSNNSDPNSQTNRESINSLSNKDNVSTDIIKENNINIENDNNDNKINQNVINKSFDKISNESYNHDNSSNDNNFDN